MTSDEMTDLPSEVAASIKRLRRRQDERMAELLRRAGRTVDQRAAERFEGEWDDPLATEPEPEGFP